MAGWIFLALWTSTNSIAVQPTTFKHVRSAEARIRERVADGYTRSATFKTIVDAVEKLSCVVYLSSTVKLSGGMRGALLHWPAADPEMPVLRVLLKANFSRNETIAVIGHELQHVIEAVRDSRSTDTFDMTATFDRLEPAVRGSNTHRYETDEAIGVTAKILEELKRGGPSPASRVPPAPCCRNVRSHPGPHARLAGAAHPVPRTSQDC
jgi:hypothetical protein